MRFRNSQMKFRVLLGVALLVLLAAVPIVYAVGSTQYGNYKDTPTAGFQYNGQLNAADITVSEGEALAHSVITSGLTAGQTYYFLIEAGLYSGTTCGFDTIVQYNDTSRLAPFVLPVGSGPPIPNGSLNLANSNQGGFMYTSGVAADSVTVGARQIDSGTGNMYWPVQFTVAPSTTTVYFYFGLRLAQPGAYNNCTRGASGWSGGSLDTNISDNLTRIQNFFWTATAGQVLTKAGPKKLNAGDVRRTIFEGQKWYDLNVNQTKDTAEPTLPGWTIKLYNCSTSSTCSTRTLLNSTTTTTTGGYYYSGVSAASIVTTNYYQVCEVLPAGNWITSHPTPWLTGDLSEKCGTAILGSSLLPVTQDFGNFQADWGDLPFGGSFGAPNTWSAAYGTTRTNSGPYHILYPNTGGTATALPNTLSTNSDPAIWLGATNGTGLVDRETDGIPTDNATGDGNDEDGITLNAPATWKGGNQGSLTATFGSSATAGGSGCLVVWFDWNHDGDFGEPSSYFTHTPGASEMAVKQYVTWSGTTGSATITFPVPFCEPDPYNCTLGKAALDVPLFYRARLFDVDSAMCAGNSLLPTGQAINGEVEDYRAPSITTAVQLEYFEALGAKKAIQVSWKTVMETDNAGFNLYRASTVDGVRTRLNAALILPLAPPGSPFGATYEYTDTSVGAKPGVTYFYWLEDLDLNGTATLHGPVSAATTNK